jgi:hypothetical protein
MFKLATRLEFKEEMEVALIEIHFPYTMYNVYNGSSTAWVKMDDKIIARCILPDDHYCNVTSVLKKLEKDLNGTFTFNLADKMVCCTSTAASDFTLRFTKTLAMQLGYPVKTELTDDENLASSEPDFNIGLPSQAFIYCSIVKPQIVASRMHELMRSIAIDTKKYSHGRYGQITFQHPQYLPVNVNVVDQIAIDIRDGTGSVLPFISGSSTLLLHFRRRSDLLY